MNKRLFCNKQRSRKNGPFCTKPVLWIWLLAFGAAMLEPAAFAAPQADPQVEVIVNGQKAAFPDAPPYIDRKSKRVMVPARFAAEKLGVKTKWNGELNQVKFSFRNKTAILTIGQTYAQVNGMPVTFGTPAVVKNNHTMIPLRFISEIFGAQVKWNAKQSRAVVTASPKIPKGTWIWDSRIIETEQETILNFAGAHDVNAIYLQINRDIAPQVYEHFIRSAKQKQISVEALAGRPEWAYKENQEQIKKSIAWTRQYNASVGPKERFAGLHFDIEPYLLAEWKTKSKSITEQWIHNLRLIEKETAGSGLKITFDVPYWLNKVKVPGTRYSMSAWLLEKFDCLVIMDYRNHALGKNGIVENAHAMLREAATLDKQLIVAVETVKNTESDRTSFYAKSPAVMEHELQAAHQQLSRYHSYAGMAVHDYKSWGRMGEG